MTVKVAFKGQRLSKVALCPSCPPESPLPYVATHFGRMAIDIIPLDTDGNHGVRDPIGKCWILHPVRLHARW